MLKDGFSQLECKKTIVLFFIAVFLLSCGWSGSDWGDRDGRIPDAGSEDYIDNLPDYVDASLWYDADKSGGDNNLCWAAVASNMIVGAGWEDDEDELFNIFKDNFSNDIGYIYDALYFYFENDLDKYALRESRQDYIYEFIASELVKGKTVSISITQPKHFLSVWGYKLYFDDTLILEITDSNDGIDMLRKMFFVWDGYWYSTGLYEGGYIDYAISLSN